MIWVMTPEKKKKEREGRRRRGRKAERSLKQTERYSKGSLRKKEDPRIIFRSVINGWRYCSAMAPFSPAS